MEVGAWHETCTLSWHQSMWQDIVAASIKGGMESLKVNQQCIKMRLTSGRSIKSCLGCDKLCVVS